MKAFLNQDLFYLIIQMLISLSVIILFFAIFLDFTFFNKNEAVQKEKKSIVETGTMTLFFLMFCLLLKIKVGIIFIPDIFVKKLIIALGTIMIIVGCIINIIGRFNLGKNWANQVKIYKEHILVRVGVYKIVRHPLYSSIILMFYGGSLVYRNVISFLAVSIIFIPFMYYRASQEEILLMQKFKEYKDYKENTGMLFPKIFRNK